MKAYVNFISGISGDRVEVKIYNEDKLIKEEIYSYGYNASYNRSIAEYARQEYEKSIKYNWEYPRKLQPYIGDLLVELFNKYGMTKEEAEYSGYYVFPQREATKDEVKEIIESLYKEL